MILLQHSYSTELLCESNHGLKFLHFDDWSRLGEQISWVVFTLHVERFDDLILELFPYIVVSYVNVFGSTFYHWIYHKEYHSLVV